MGTSKGYIAPSTPKWALAKRGISGYVGNPSTSNKKEAVSKFAKAMNSDNSMTNRASAIFSSFASFVSSSRNNGLKQTLNDFEKSYINSLPPEEAFFQLINSFSEGNTTDDIIANNCISEAMIILDVNDLKKISTIGINTLIKELVCQFAKQKFAQMFDKQIRNKCNNVITANKRLEELQEYIYFTIKNELTEEKISEINPLELADEEIVKNTMNTAFDYLENYYD